ncbi:hypothetical protein JXQ31_19830 [candidate division KSB1 bacterium]|nr:hypothetical protein [candidate division KSB1 bacterium]
MIKLIVTRQRYEGLLSVISFLFLILSFLVTQSESRADVILAGHVINGTRDSSAVKNITVKLQRMKTGDEAPVDLDKTNTSEDGEFRFVINNFDSSASYFSMVNYQGARYYSGSEQALAQKIVVFDSTHSLDHISTLIHHFLIDDFGSVINIRETRIIHNPDMYAITGGIHDTHIGEAVLQFSLPDNYSNFNPISVYFGSNISAHGSTVYTNAVLFPGNSQISYSYQVPWNKNSANITLTLGQHTRSFDIFINSSDVNIISNQLQDLGPFNIRNTQYKRYNAAELHAGTPVTFTIQRAGQKKIIPLLPVTLVAIVLLAGSVIGHYLNSRAKVRPVKTEKVDLENRKNEIIEIIARLDTEKKTEKNDNRRKELFEELQNIELSLMAGKDSPKSRKNK